PNEHERIERQACDARDNQCDPQVAQALNWRHRSSPVVPVARETILRRGASRQGFPRPNDLRLSGAGPVALSDDGSPRTVCLGKTARVGCSRGLGGTRPSLASTASTAPSRRYIECDRHDEYKTSECLGEPILKSDGERHHRREDAPLDERLAPASWCRRRRHSFRRDNTLT